MAGVVETNSGGTLLPAETFSGTATITTSAENNRLQASFSVREGVPGNEVTTAALQFGDVSGPHRLRSAFIDDNIFAAQQSFSRPTLIDGTSIADGDSRIFMVTSNAVPLAQIDGVTPCACDFLKWGWWGGEVVRRGIVDGGDIRDRVHLATWVAGVVPTFAEITGQTGTASYSGHAIGNVINAGANYIAAGTYTQSWNFAAKNGTATITNFDVTGTGGITISGAINAPLTAPANFGGVNTLTGTPGFTGSVNGSIFSSPTDPVAGVGGNFSISGTNYQAAGTFAAQKQ
jgi:hypothetical protein